MLRIGSVVFLSVALAGGAAHARLAPGDLARPEALDGVLLAENVPPPPPAPPQPGYYQQPPPGYYQQPPQPPAGYYQQPPPGYAPPGYYAPQPPRSTVTRTEPRMGLFISGLVIFAVGWLSDITLTYSFNHSPTWEAVVPFAGPLLQSNDTYSTNDTAAVARFFLIWDFVIQVAGGTMALLGIALQHQVTVYAGGTPHTIRWAIIPTVGGGHFSARF